MKKRVIEFQKYKYGFRFHWINIEVGIVRFAFNIGFSYPEAEFRNSRDFYFRIWINRKYLPHTDTSWGFEIKNIF